MNFFYKFSLLLLFVLSVTYLSAQKNVTELVESKRKELDQLPALGLLKAASVTPNSIDLKDIKNYQLFSIDKQALANRGQAKKDLLKLDLPFKNRKLIIELVKVDIFGPDFKLTKASNPNQPLAVQAGDYYWGKVKGIKNSMAGISIFEDRIEGLLSIDGETFNLGRLENDPFHIMYLSDDVPFEQPECLVDGNNVPDINNEDTSIPATAGNLNSVGSVGIYVEVDYDIYQAKGSSITNATNYMTAIFNEVAIIYANESINLYISEMKVWDVLDPYEIETNSSNRLTAFRDNLNGNYNGDLAHLVTFDGGGGIAYVNVLCNSFYGVGYSGINNSYAAYPTYSWTVNVLAHELGHNFGSPHTHDCKWNGNNTPIDGCGAQAGYPANGCAITGPIPASGTVMSYCHLLSGVGIDLNNGFGQQPGDLIRSRVVASVNAECLLNSCVTGAACNDGNACTTNDVYDANCNCAGTFQDSDGDGVCDADDKCPGADDTLDADNDGTPDACDTCDNSLTGTSCDDADACTTNDVLDANCNCAGTLLDDDGDGVCNTDDICAGGDDTIDTDGDGLPDACDACNDNLVGTSCDDGDACTTNDVYDADCNCAGTFQDSDGDGVCDGEDICPAGDDAIDSDNDGIPDACDLNCVNQTTNFPQNALTHSGGGSGSIVLVFEGVTRDVQFSISEINSKTNGNASRRYIEEVTVNYVDGNGNNQLYGVYNGQNTSSAAINISEVVQSVTISLTDTYDGNTSTQMSVNIGAVAICAAPCEDSDNDGVCNTVDVCPNFDDNMDADGDGIPDACDDCNNNTNSFPNSTLTHNGTGSSSTTLNLINQSDISFTISQLGARTGGKPSNRYTDIVEVSYKDGTGTTQTGGTFSGAAQSSITIEIPGAVTEITVTLSEGYSGGTSTISANLSEVSSCQNASSALNRIITQSAVAPNFKMETYPNPFNQSLQINLENLGIGTKGELNVVDYLGRIIYQTKLQETTTFYKELNTSEWPLGLYFIKYQDKEKREIQKVIKTR